MAKKVKNIVFLKWNGLPYLGKKELDLEHYIKLQKEVE